MQELVSSSSGIWTEHSQCSTSGCTWSLDSSCFLTVCIRNVWGLFFQEMISKTKLFWLPVFLQVLGPPAALAARFTSRSDSHQDSSRFKTFTLSTCKYISISTIDTHLSRKKVNRIQRNVSTFVTPAFWVDAEQTGIACQIETLRCIFHLPGVTTCHLSNVQLLVTFAFEIKR